jgi:general secretion pathway protein K
MRPAVIRAATTSIGQQGVALVMAMGVVALAAVAATAILVSLSTWSRAAELAANHAQAQQLVGAGIDWARAVLSDDRHLGDIDYLGEPWSVRLPPVPVENGELAGFIEDQQGCFNLNNLLLDGALSATQDARFRRLLTILGLPLELDGALVDWIDADSEPQPRGGAEDNVYLALDPPYRAANQPLIDIDELALVRGFDPGVRARLAPFITALPGRTTVNVNTASPEVLAAVVEGLDLDAARLLVARRQRSYFHSNSEFRNQLGKGARVPDQDIGVGSAYFQVTVRVTSGGAQARGKALLARLDPNRWPEFVWRKYQ